MTHPRTIEAVTPPRPTEATNARPATDGQARRAALASFLGSLLEYYDFFIYGSASALVFATVFFPAGDPALATVLSLATFGIAYVARPFGAVVFGHIGDRVGRRAALIATLLLMGVSSLAIGLLPGYAAVGALAPVLLVVCRLLQGMSAGGEAAGASTLTLEYAPEGRRGFFTSFTMAGFAAGMVLATLVFIPVAALPREQLMAWGWRIPFLLSTVVLLVAYLIRRKLDETPVFHEVEEEAEVAALPLARLIRTQWRDLLRVVACSLFAVFQSIFAVFALAYGTSEGVGLDRTALLWVSALAKRRGHRRDPGMGGAVRPDRPPAGVADRRARLQRARRRLPVGHLDRFAAAGVRHRPAVRRRGLQRGQRAVAVVLHRDVRCPGALHRVRDRHPDRVPPSRFRALDRLRDHE